MILLPSQNADHSYNTYDYKVVNYHYPGKGRYVIEGVEPSHWDQLKKSGSSWDSNPGPSG